MTHGSWRGLHAGCATIDSGLALNARTIVVYRRPSLLIGCLTRSLRYLAIRIGFTINQTWPMQFLGIESDVCIKTANFSMTSPVHQSGVCRTYQH